MSAPITHVPGCAVECGYGRCECGAMTVETDRRRHLERMSDDQLQRLEDRTCYEFTGCTLYLKSPERLIGDTTTRAQQLRRQHVAEAEARWFDIQAEWNRRRESNA